ncbi:hypothetical protein GOODEAATRI_017089 [Goodea atripinnis]|uniref:Uncharacterized protein n=1 Tax=Goodea atripinnis TaxID=208336 RepID=A0ABV0P4Z7_9TELE
MQDSADQGVMFVGFVQEPYGAPCSRIREPETPSLSLHSSPSSVLGSLGSCSPLNPSSPRNQAEHKAKIDSMDKEGNMKASRLDGEKNQNEINSEHHWGSGVGSSRDGISPAASPLSVGDLENSEELTEEDSSYHNNNKDIIRDIKDKGRYRRDLSSTSLSFTALFTLPPTPSPRIPVTAPAALASQPVGVVKEPAKIPCPSLLMPSLP